MKRLSICIPTYNRNDELIRLLCSIFQQVDENSIAEDIEVYVGDNCSIDKTCEALECYRKVKKYFRYYRNDENKGYALNINRLVAEAQGEYCWLMGSDETVLPQAIVNVLATIERNNDVVLFDVVTKGKLRKLHSPENRTEYHTSDKGEVLEFISECTEISSFFAFISSIVVRKEYWGKIVLSEYEQKHPYTHMLRIAKGIEKYNTSIEYCNIAVVETGAIRNEYTARVGQQLLLDELTFSYLGKNIFRDISINSALEDLFFRQYTKLIFNNLKWHFSRNQWIAYIDEMDGLSSRYDTKYGICNTVINCAYRVWKHL